ncbi:Eco57I restriction-modification methylase domain-containing protein [Paenalcaligenes hermetiae]|uniref:site-specific DNA-methyltransferase (adenine-specific) n=1 Tax=Paenalcaligenes hermetiae TaxID=1157987 RepID=A0ABP9MB49_9BURK
MSNGLLNKQYNPDVLSCLSNLSNDEVFTPPEIANAMLDLLPAEIWQDSTATFLDPASKSGVFLREIAQRLDKGLTHEIPNKQERLNHIFKKQLFAISITELTGLISRRSVYCSKTANSKYSLCNDFSDDRGNIRYERIEHCWSPGNNRCVYCGANESGYERDDSLENHAYEFIHTDSPERIFNMKFDVIIGNPPYQLSDGGAGASAIPLYHKFVEQAKKMNPRYLSMIIPSRWFAGGKGLDQFRNEMLNDDRIEFLIDFVDAKECFPGVSLGGGVCYFLWNRDYRGDCVVTNVLRGKKDSLIRPLNSHDIFIRNNQSLKIVEKIKKKNKDNIVNIISSRNPFGFSSSDRGRSVKKIGDITLHSSKGKGYVSIDQVNKGEDLINEYKVMFSKVTSEHAGEPDKSGKFRVLSTAKVLPPMHVCTDSYLIAGPFSSNEIANNFLKYLSTKFARFLLLQAVTSINLSKDKFLFVPRLDFNKEWGDDDLYEIFGLSSDDIEHVELIMKEWR